MARFPLKQLAPVLGASTLIFTPAEEAEAGVMSKLFRPSIARTFKHLTPAEADKLTWGTVFTYTRLRRSLPSVDEMAASALGGAAKRGWYKDSTKALVEIFGEDAPRFAALLAATSPQTSVDDNLFNTLSIWMNWKQLPADKQADPASIKQVLADSVQGEKGAASVLEAWESNSILALSTASADLPDIILSGPKVDSFMRNLMGVVNEVTNDTWMARAMGHEQDIFSGSKTKTDPGKTPGYLAANSLVRETADRLTKMTGEVWTPAEVQETVWSFVKPLYEMQNKDLGAEQILREGKLTDTDVFGVAAFGDLLTKPGRYRDMLEKAGYGNRLDAVTPSTPLDPNADHVGSAYTAMQPEMDAMGRRLQGQKLAADEGSEKLSRMKEHTKGDGTLEQKSSARWVGTLADGRSISVVKARGDFIYRLARQEVGRYGSLEEVQDLITTQHKALLEGRDNASKIKQRLTRIKNASDYGLTVRPRDSGAWAVVRKGQDVIEEHATAKEAYESLQGMDWEWAATQAVPESRMQLRANRAEKALVQINAERVMLRDALHRLGDAATPEAKKQRAAITNQLKKRDEWESRMVFGEGLQGDFKIPPRPTQPDRIDLEGYSYDRATGTKTAAPGGYEGIETVGKTLDFGSSGTPGVKSADTFNPFPVAGETPKFTRIDNLPGNYTSVVSVNLLSHLDPAARRQAVLDMIKQARQGGTIQIVQPGRKGAPPTKVRHHTSEGGVVQLDGTYYKSLTPAEIERLVKEVAGEGVEVTKTKNGVTITRLSSGIAAATVATGTTLATDDAEAGMTTALAKVPNILFKAIDDLPQTKGGVEQMLAMLKNKGARKEDIDALRVHLKSSKSVTQEQLIEVATRINPKILQHTVQAPEGRPSIRLMRRNDDHSNSVRPDDWPEIDQFLESDYESVEMWPLYYERADGDIRGSEMYLLQVKRDGQPDRWVMWGDDMEGMDWNDRGDFETADQAFAQGQEMANDALDFGTGNQHTDDTLDGESSVPDDMVPRFEDYALGADNEISLDDKALGTDYREVYYQADRKASDQAYEHRGQYSVPPMHRAGKKETDINRVYHTRLQDVQDIDGERGILIDELQSDWSMNRNPKFDWESAQVGALQSAEYNAEFTRLHEAGGTEMPATIDTPELTEFIKSRDFTATPGMPLQKDLWVEHGLYSTMYDAMERGYNTIYWTTGEHQAVRYYGDGHSPDQLKPLAKQYNKRMPGSKLLKRLGLTADQVELPDGTTVWRVTMTDKAKDVIRSGTPLFGMGAGVSILTPDEVYADELDPANDLPDELPRNRMNRVRADDTIQVQPEPERPDVRLPDRISEANDVIATHENALSGAGAQALEAAAQQERDDVYQPQVDAAVRPAGAPNPEKYNYAAAAQEGMPPAPVPRVPASDNEASGSFDVPEIDPETGGHVVQPMKLKHFNKPKEMIPSQTMDQIYRKKTEVGHPAVYPLARGFSETVHGAYQAFRDISPGTRAIADNTFGPSPIGEVMLPDNFYPDIYKEHGLSATIGAVLGMEGLPAVMPGLTGYLGAGKVLGIKGDPSTRSRWAKRAVSSTSATQMYDPRSGSMANAFHEMADIFGIDLNKHITDYLYVHKSDSIFKARLKMAGDELGIAAYIQRGLFEVADHYMRKTLQENRKLGVEGETLMHEGVVQTHEGTTTAADVDDTYLKGVTSTADAYERSGIPFEQFRRDALNFGMPEDVIELGRY